MATAKRENPQPPPPPDHIILNLSLREAEVLRGLLFSVVIGNHRGARGELGGIGDALHRVGVSPAIDVRYKGFVEVV